MRLLSLSALIVCFYSATSAHAQIFPTLDPNAPPAVTKDVTAPAPPAANPDPVEDVPVISSPTQKPASNQTTSAAENPVAAQKDEPGVTYMMGPQDTLNIRVLDMEELGDKPYPIDLRGDITLPRVGRVHVAGLTLEQLEADLTRRYREYLQDPVVSVIVADFHSQPVSILGAVGNPGVHQIKGSKTLFEVISEAGGLKETAGNRITITRRMSNGPLPLPNAATDPTGQFSIADLNIRSVMSARNPQDNIPVKPYDVITVAKADLIYVIGAVKRPGGFPLEERANMTVLQALALCQGFDKGAATGRARILRSDDVTHARTEIQVNLKSILDGKGSDQPLLANDILFVPTSATKLASYRALEAIVSTGTGLAIYRP